MLHLCLVSYVCLQLPRNADIFHQEAYTVGYAEFRGALLIACTTILESYRNYPDTSSNMYQRRVVQKLLISNFLKIVTKDASLRKISKRSHAIGLDWLELFKRTDFLYCLEILTNRFYLNIFDITQSQSDLLNLSCCDQAKSELRSVARSSMHTCQGNCMVIGRAVVHYAQTAQTFSAGIKCQYCIQLELQISKAITYLGCDTGKTSSYVTAKPKVTGNILTCPSWESTPDRGESLLEVSCYALNHTAIKAGPCF